MEMEIFRNVLKSVNTIIPKNNKLVIFSSKPDFSDNALALYEYLSSNEKYNYLELVWIVNDKSHINRNKNVYYKNSVIGLWKYLRAKYILTSHGLFVGTAVPKQINVGMWHGMPLKHITPAIPKEKGGDYTFAICTSPTFQKIMADCFNIDVTRVKAVGLPRNDKLLHPDTSLEILGVPHRTITVFWLPTFRTPLNSSEKHCVKQEGIDYEYGIPIWNSNNIFILDEHLKKYDVTLVIKMHRLQKFDKSQIPHLSNITFITSTECEENNIDLYRLLACGNALITDYSSVYIDYLATNNPIAFTIEDIKQYSEDRGFSFENPLEYMPGVHIKTKEDFLTFIDSLALKQDNYVLARKEARKILNIFEDDKNSMRVADLIFKELS